MPYAPGPPAFGSPDPSSRPAGAPERPQEGRAFGPPPAIAVTFPHLTAGRRELGVTLKARPVIHLRQGVEVGRHVCRTIRRVGGQTALFGHDRVRLESADFKRIDAETLRHGLPLLDLAAGGTGVVPAFWRTVSGTQGRFALLYAGLQADADAGRLLVELFGVPPDVRAETLAEACSHLEAQRRAVVVHAPPDAAALTRVAAAGARGVSLDFAGVDTEGPAAWAQAQDLIAAARAAAPHVLLTNLEPRLAPQAARAGATHAVFAEGRATLA